MPKRKQNDSSPQAGKKRMPSAPGKVNKSKVGRPRFFANAQRVKSSQNRGSAYAELLSGNAGDGKTVVSHDGFFTISDYLDYKVPVGSNNKVLNYYFDVKQAIFRTGGVSASDSVLVNIDEVRVWAYNRTAPLQGNADAFFTVNSYIPVVAGDNVMNSALTNNRSQVVRPNYLNNFHEVMHYKASNVFDLNYRPAVDSTGKMQNLFQLECTSPDNGHTIEGLPLQLCVEIKCSQAVQIMTELKLNSTIYTQGFDAFPSGNTVPEKTELVYMDLNKVAKRRDSHS
jgi:hypothetical protein